MKYFKEVGMEFRQVEDRLVDEFWEDRSRLGEGDVFIHPLNFAGENIEQKIQG